MEKCFGLLRLAAMVVALLVFPPLVSSADIAVGTTTEQGVIRSTVKFDSGDAINAISRAIPSCPTMTVTFLQDNASQVTTRSQRWRLLLGSLRTQGHQRNRPRSDPASSLLGLW